MQRIPSLLRGAAVVFAVGLSPQSDITDVNYDSAVGAESVATSAPALESAPVLEGLGVEEVADEVERVIHPSEIEEVEVPMQVSQQTLELSKEFVDALGNMKRYEVVEVGGLYFYHGINADTKILTISGFACNTSVYFWWSTEKTGFGVTPLPHVTIDSGATVIDSNATESLKLIFDFEPGANRMVYGEEAAYADSLKYFLRMLAAADANGEQ
jgi:hypothetical protein